MVAPSRLEYELQFCAPERHTDVYLCSFSWQCELLECRVELVAGVPIRIIMNLFMLHKDSRQKGNSCVHPLKRWFYGPVAAERKERLSGPQSLEVNLLEK